MPGNMIRLFKRDAMTYTPFDFPESLARLAQAGVVLTGDIREADVVASRWVRKLRRQRIRYPWKNFFVWTHEPRFDKYARSLARGLLGLGEVHVMNLYTGDVSCDNFDVLGDVVDRRLARVTAESLPALRHRKIAALMTYQNKPLWRDGRNLDLSVIRNGIAAAGHALGKVDIFGQGWPPGVAREDSRGAGWHDRKFILLADYHFNLCFENTTSPFYCSEKIWDSIRAGCLPIYFSAGNRIYDDFPRDSFIDYCELASPAALFDLVDRMPIAEFRRRLNLCIDTFNAVFEKRQQRTYYDGRFSEELLQRIIDKLRRIVGEPQVTGSRAA